MVVIFTAIINTTTSTFVKIFFLNFVFFPLEIRTIRIVFYFYYNQLIKKTTKNIIIYYKGEMVHKK